MLDLAFPSQLSVTTALSSRLKNTSCFLNNGTSFITRQALSILKATASYERTIQTVKRTLRKATVINEDPALALLDLRTTPEKYTTTPPQKLMGRTLRTNFLSIKPPLKTSKPTTMSKTTTAQYNASAQKLPVLHPGDNLRLRNGRNWSRKGTVVVPDQSPRSYHVRTETGNVFRPDRRHLIKIKQALSSRPCKPSPATVDPPPVNLPTTRTTHYSRNVRPPQYLY